MDYVSFQNRIISSYNQKFGWGLCSKKNGVMNKQEKIKELLKMSNYLIDKAQRLRLEAEQLENEKEVLRWEDLGNLEGWLMSPFGKPVEATFRYDYEACTPFKTKEQAEAAIALAKISQLLPVYNEGWQPDWNNVKEKYVIRFIDDETSIDSCIRNRYFLSFKSSEIRDKFLEHNRDLIEQAKPLL